MLIVDAHLDLADNAIRYKRNLMLKVDQIRAVETVDPERGIISATFPQLREGSVGLIFATIFALPEMSKTIMPLGRGTPYRDTQGAHMLGMQQLDLYHRWVDEENNRIRLVGDTASLDVVLASQTGDAPLLGIVPLMEGADPIREPEELELWVEKGLRIVGLAWDDTQYAPGAWRGSRDGLPVLGRELLEVMADYHMILDLSHMNERSAMEALEVYEGIVVATHSNARALVPGERQLSDEQIQGIGERGGVVGIVLYNRFLKAGYRKGNPKNSVTIDHVVAHIDHICQLLGDARHVGIGSDMDGGFGAGDLPAGINSAADLPKISVKLAEYGYTADDINGIMGNNWISVLRKAFVR